MSASKVTGKWTGKIVNAATAAPKATSSKFSKMKHDLAEGYREVVPAKTKTKSAD